jgi:Zinc dependent phospholipase C
VRSGDFVTALIVESKDLNEYAFALGALAHYAGDTLGHPLATNRSIALMYPKLAKEYGPVVTYEDKPSAHTRVEFAFEVDQVAEGNYAPKAYHDFIGFEVSKPLLERAFAKTYSIELSSITGSVDLAIASYRHGVATVIPRATKVAWHLKKKQIQNSDPSETPEKYIYNISRSGYRKDWGNIYEKPDFFARLKALFLRFLPKVGPFSALAFHPPTPVVEQMYMNSFNKTLNNYQNLLLAQKELRLELPNYNFDTGEKTETGIYRLADKSYANLLDKVTDRPVSAELRQNILNFYADPGKPFVTKKNAKKWQKLLRELETLKTAPMPATTTEKPPPALVAPTDLTGVAWRFTHPFSRQGLAAIAERRSGSFQRIANGHCITSSDLNHS